MAQPQMLVKIKRPILQHSPDVSYFSSQNINCKYGWQVEHGSGDWLVAKLSTRNLVVDKAKWIASLNWAKKPSNLTFTIFLFSRFWFYNVWIIII